MDFVNLGTFFKHNIKTAKLPSPKLPHSYKESIVPTINLWYTLRYSRHMFPKELNSGIFLLALKYLQDSQTIDTRTFYIFKLFFFFVFLFTFLV